MRPLVWSLAMGIAVAGSISSPSAADALHLLCEGVGVATATETTIGNATTNNGASVQGTATTYSRQRSVEQVTVEIEGDSGRILVPNALLPPLNSGGKNGWWKLDQLEVDEGEILGRFSLNLLNKPRVRIDRRTGLISIKGFGGLAFDGKCRKFDPDPAARQF